MEKPHKRLEVWKKSMELALDVYRVTKDFPVEERYGLISQMRRAAVSIPSNIAEGAARDTRQEFAHFLHIAQASLSELDTQLDLSQALGYITNEFLASMQSLMESVDKMLTGLIKSLKQNN